MKNFLIEANRFLFSHPEKIIIKDSAYHDMQLIEYHSKSYSYRNYFTEGRNVYGQIIITKNKKPVWCMQFQGGVVNEQLDERTARHLKYVARKNRSLSDERYPIRGPREATFADLHYQNDIFGDLRRFQGQEIIQKEENTLFMMKLSGGELT